MALGLGQMLGMGILGQFFGGEDKQGLLQQNQQQGQNQGFNLNNMSPGQWANTAIALNSMRLEPDPNLATAMRENIASANKAATAQTSRERTAKALRGMISDKYPNGRVDLAEAVLSGALEPTAAMKMAYEKVPMSAFAEKQQWLKDNPNATDKDLRLAGFSVPEPDAFMRQGMETAQWLDTQGRPDLSAMVKSRILDPTTALEIAMKKESIPDWQQKYNFVMKKLEKGETLSDIEKALFSIPIKETSETRQKLELLANPPKDLVGEDGWTDQQLEVGFGITKESIPVFQAKLDKIDSLKKSDSEFKLYSEEEYKEMYRKVLAGGGTDIDIDIEGDEAELDAGNYASAATQDLYKDHKAIIDGLPKLIQQIQKIHAMQDILDRADEGEIRTGIFEPLQSQVSRIAAGLGLGSGDQAASMQLLQSYMGGDVFPLIRALGIGARGMDTPEERKFLQASFVGEVTMEVSTLQAITQRRLDILLEALDTYNLRAGTLTEDGQNSMYFKMYEDTFKRRISPVNVPIRQTKAVIDALEADKNEIMDKYF